MYEKYMIENSSGTPIRPLPSFDGTYPWWVTVDESVIVVSKVGEKENGN